MTRVAFWILWGIAMIVAAVILYFFLAGLADGSVSSFNIALWLGLLLVVVAVIGGSLWLHLAGKSVPGLVLTLVLAGPGLLAALFIAIAIVAKPRWN